MDFEDKKMARVFQAWEYVMNFVDTGGQQASVRVELRADDAADMAAVEGAATAIRAAYVGASDGTLVSDSLRKVWVEDSISLPTDAQREEKAVISLAIEGKPLDTARVTVPMPKTALFVAPTGPNSDYVDSSKAEVIALMSLYQTSGGVAQISDGDTVSDTAPFKGGFRKHYASGKNSLPNFG